MDIIDTDKQKVECSEEVKTTCIFETANHIFKINKDKLSELEEKENFIKKISSKIQKSMKQKVEKASGKDWEVSYRMILHEVTGQFTLEGETE